VKRQCIMTALVVTGLALGGLGQASAEESAAASKIDPAAIQALDAMGDYLKSVKTFTVMADQTRDEVLESGQKIQLSSTIKLEVRRPNGLRADIQRDRVARQMYFDGTHFTLLGPDTGMYATVSAPGTIGELVTQIETKYGVEMPLVDFYQWGSDTGASADIREAVVIGPSNLGGEKTTHYAFRQEGLDWQIWIAQGEQPLPVRYAITTLDDESRPEYKANLSWDTETKLDDGIFTFVPSEGQYPIEFAVPEQNPDAE